MGKLFQKLAVFVVFLSVILAAGSAQASLWRILPGENVASLTQKQNIVVVGTDIARLDAGMMVLVTYLQGGRTVYRCVEYVTEFQFDLLRAACFVAVAPEPRP